MQEAAGAGAEADVERPAPACRAELPLFVWMSVLPFLDGAGLCAFGQLSRDLSALTDSRALWEQVCFQRWPHLRLTYDCYTTYGGDWRRLFLDGNRRNRSASLDWDVEDFWAEGGPARRLSDPIQVGAYSFRLAADPRGNANVDVASRGLSVYLLVDGVEELARADPDWEVCAAFTLGATNQLGSSGSIEWSSSLPHNRFCAARQSWGLHSLLRLSELEEGGEFCQNDVVKLQVRIRLLFVTVRVFQAAPQAAEHVGFGMANYFQTDEATGEPTFGEEHTVWHSMTVDRFAALACAASGADPAAVRLWAVSQPLPDTPLAPRLQLYPLPGAQGAPPTMLEALRTVLDEQNHCCVWLATAEGGLEAPAAPDAALAPIALAEPVAPLPLHRRVMNGIERLDDPAARSAESELPARLFRDEDAAEDLPADHLPLAELRMLLFAKSLRADGSVRWLGYFIVRHTTPLRAVFDAARALLGAHGQPQPLVAFCEEQPAAWHPDVPPPPPLREADATPVGQMVRPSSVLTFAAADEADGVARFYRGELRRLQEKIWRLRDQHEAYFSQACSELAAPDSQGQPAPAPAGVAAVPRPRRIWLDDLSRAFAEIGMQWFRVRNNFYQECGESILRTLRLAAEGRHLGFCCDQCGATDFPGMRHKCCVCNDYDLCAGCRGKETLESHRFRYTSGKWKKEKDFSEHSGEHEMREVRAVP